MLHAKIRHTSHRLLILSRLFLLLWLFLRLFFQQMFSQKLSQSVSVLFLFFCFSSAFAEEQSALTEKSPWENSAVILMYHNVSSDAPAITSVSPLTFNQHMQYLDDNDFAVWPLIKILIYLYSGWALPEKVVALTFDDAYRSVYSEALPVLKEKGWPFTVFVTAKYIGEGYTHFMSWDQLREIKQYGGDVGNHSFSHPHFIRKRSNEGEQQWSRRISKEIQQTQTLLQQQQLNPIPVLAYPYGEFSAEVKSIARQLDYFGVGQQSGAVSYHNDFQSVPRYAMATGFDDLQNFAIKVNSLSLPVTVLEPPDGVLSKGVQEPELILRLAPGAYRADQLRCFASAQGLINHEWLDRARLIVSVKANKSILSGRTRYNCTAPSNFDINVFYWFSYQWMKPDADGSWYREH